MADPVGFTEGNPIPEEYLAQAQGWLQAAADHLMSWQTIWQLVAILIIGVVAYVLSRYPVRRLSGAADSRDSSLDFELVVWLTEEAVKKPAKIVADYNWAIHAALTKYEIEIPFPQRDLHLRSASPNINVRIDKPDGFSEG